MPIEIRAEKVQDHEAVRQVNYLAFGQNGEARLVDALRAGGFSPVSLVAEINGQVVGHIMFSGLNILTDKGAVQANPRFGFSAKLAESLKSPFG